MLPSDHFPLFPFHLISSAAWRAEKPMNSSDNVQTQIFSGFIIGPP
jgi:hypothetical protein